MAHPEALSLLMKPPSNHGLVPSAPPATAAPAAGCRPACRSDCWFLEGDREFVWQAICSQNQPPYESIPPHINSTVMDIKLNNNKIRSVQHASLRRFVNLTNLDLTHNAIESIEDGAFSAQRNLRVLRLSHNLVARLDEGLLRGLAGLESLYLQSNRIEVVTATALRPCPQLGILDLSDNRLAWLDEHVFDGSPTLRLLNLSGNPFHCGCTLLPFLRWLHFQQPLWEPRATCEPGLLPLLGGNDRQQRGATSSSRKTARPTRSAGPRCRRCRPRCWRWTTAAEEATVAVRQWGQSSRRLPSRTCTSSTRSRAPCPMSVQSVGPTSAVVNIHIPRVGSRMYMLVRGNGTASEVVKHLPLTDETVSLKDLQPGTTYLFCVAYMKGGRREHIKCAEVETRPRGWWDAAASSAVRHYVMTTLYCLIGMAFVLGAVYCCLRRRRRHEERQQQQQSKSATLKKTLADMRQGSQTEAGGASYQLLPTKSRAARRRARRPSSPPGAPPEPDDAKAAEAGDTPRTAKGNYLEVRTGEGTGDPAEGRDGGGTGKRRGAEERRDSVTEIATIAKEVDKVNRIINNCIDALKSEAGATAPPVGLEPPAGPPAPGASRGARNGSPRDPLRPPPSLSRPPPPTGTPMAPCHKRASCPSIRRAAPGPTPWGGARTAAAIPCTGLPRVAAGSRGARGGRRGGRRGGPRQGPPRRPRPRAARRLRDVHRVHAPGGPGPRRPPPLLPGARAAAAAATPVHPAPAAAAAATAAAAAAAPAAAETAAAAGAPAWHAGACAPRASCRECRSPARPSVQKIWVRFKPQQQQQQQQQQQPQQHKKVEEEHMAAGTRAQDEGSARTDEDLHDILDFWKGVSAQQKP
ncbi:LOW QUALITY PROTEIN: protein ELFN1 [Petromyzon marinus]|uniref:LOW QUALITY PROTEIN: protein ELFN1 n=1 Tax=Petromyzon marinus TaxID=7757 RepID=UPI003F7276EB